MRIIFGVMYTTIYLVRKQNYRCISNHTNISNGKMMDHFGDDKSCIFVVNQLKSIYTGITDSKGHQAKMGPIWGRQDPGGPHVGPMLSGILYGQMIDMFNSRNCFCLWVNGYSMTHCKQLKKKETNRRFRLSKLVQWCLFLYLSKQSFQIQDNVSYGQTP